MRRPAALLLLLLVLPLAAACGGHEPVAAPVPAGAEASAAGVPNDVAREIRPEAAWALPTPELPYNVREGRSLFRYYCAPCHGEEGRGDGFNAYNLDPRPRDLSEPGFHAERSDDDLAAVIRMGGGAAGLSTGMPPWGRTLGERKIGNLVLYLRSLRASNEAPAP